jgi:hypothetical protein
MPSGDPNPFERYDLDPSGDPAEITDQLRQRIEDAPEGERAALRAVWERLMLHPRERVVAVLGAHPRLAPLRRSTGRPFTAIRPPRLEPWERAVLPSLERAIASIAPTETVDPFTLLRDDPILTKGSRG